MIQRIRHVIVVQDVAAEALAMADVRGGQQAGVCKSGVDRYTGKIARIPIFQEERLDVEPYSSAADVALFDCGAGGRLFTVKALVEGRVHCCWLADPGSVLDVLGTCKGFRMGLGLGGAESEEPESGEESVVRDCE